MKWQSALAIYVLFWSLCVFFVLPFGVRTSQETGAKMVPGQADSAPDGFSLKRVAIRTTILSSILFGLFLLNYVYGWVTTDSLDWFNRG